MVFFCGLYCGAVGGPDGLEGEVVPVGIPAPVPVPAFAVVLAACSPASDFA